MLVKTLFTGEKISQAVKNQAAKKRINKTLIF